EFVDRRGGQPYCGVLLHDVLHDRDDIAAVCNPAFLRKLLQQILPPRHRDDAHSLTREALGDGAPNSDAGAADESGPGLEIEVHVRKPSFLKKGGLIRSIEPSFASTSHATLALAGGECPVGQNAAIRPMAGPGGFGLGLVVRATICCHW